MSGWRRSISSSPSAEPRSGRGVPLAVGLDHAPGKVGPVTRGRHLANSVKVGWNRRGHSAVSTPSPLTVVTARPIVASHDFVDHVRHDRCTPTGPLNPQLAVHLVHAHRLFTAVGSNDALTAPRPIVRPLDDEPACGNQFPERCGRTRSTLADPVQQGADGECRHDESADCCSEQRVSRVGPHRVSVRSERGPRGSPLPSRGFHISPVFALPRPLTGGGTVGQHVADPQCSCGVGGDVHGVVDRVGKVRDDPVPPVPNLGLRNGPIKPMPLEILADSVPTGTPHPLT